MIKKSFNLDKNISDKIDEIISENPHFSFTVLVNQALATWIKNPVLTLNTSNFTKDDVSKFMEEHSELMDALGS
jgi:hypothetical protein